MPECVSSIQKGQFELSVGEKKYFSLYPRLLANTSIPLVKGQINKRKANKLITCINPVYKGGTQENLLSPQSVPNFHFKYHLQLKTKDIGGRGPVMGGFQAKHSIKNGIFVLQKSLPSSLIRVSRDLVLALFLVPLGDIFTNGDFPCKCKCLLQKGNFYLIFRASPVSAVS